MALNGGGAEAGTASQAYLESKAVRDTRSLIAELCRHFYTLGWVSGTGGSVAIRVHDDSLPRPNQLIALSPSGVQKERMEAEDMYVLSASGNVLSAPSAKPYPNKTPKCTDSADVFMKAFEMRNAGAVVHSHGIESCLVTMLNPSAREFRITHPEMIKGIQGHVYLEMIKGIQGHGYYDELVVPIIENTAHEYQLTKSLAEAIEAYPRTTAVLVRNHGVYIWGDTWISAKKQAECYHYLFDAAVKLYQLGLDWSTPNYGPLQDGKTLGGGGDIQKSLEAMKSVPRCILLDIEGTTTPISFVSDVLFPYAQDNVESHLSATFHTAETQDDIRLLRSQIEDDLERCVHGAVPVPADEEKEKVIAALVPNIEAMIRADRKITSLKQLQGHIWKTGCDLPDPDDKVDEPSENQKRKRTDADIDGCHEDPDAKSAKRIMLLLTKPSYAMYQKTESLRSLHRRRLRMLLSRLIREQNWKEACGVMSVYLLATVKDRCPENNRFKYTALFTLLQRMSPNGISSSRVQKTYDIWMRRIGCSKNHSAQDVQERLTVHLEFMLFCLEEGDMDEAHQAALTLLQDKRIAGSSQADLVLGLTYYKLWYTRIPEVMKRIGSQQADASSWLESLEYISNTSKGASVVPNTICKGQDHTACGGWSDSSVMNVKKAPTASQLSVKIGNVDEMPPQASLKVEPIRFYLNSDENGEPQSSDKGNLHDRGGLSCLGVLPTWLLPIRLPQDLKDCEDAIQVHQCLMDNHYKDALKYLRLALDSPLTKLDALLPLIQLLLSGGRIEESLNVVDMVCRSSDSVFPRRLKAALLEHLDPENLAALIVCYEDILHKDPTCRRIVERLVIMHKRENYDLRSLLEMISLHLDATYGDRNVWKELAECFLKVSLIDQDCMSACQSRSVCLNVTPSPPSNGYLGKRWGLCCSWWLSGHFSNEILNQESVAGDLDLLCYKAACAAHMYGKKIKYVKDVLKILVQRNEPNMLMLLQEHIKNSIRLHTCFQ